MTQTLLSILCVVFAISAYEAQANYIYTVNNGNWNHNNTWNINGTPQAGDSVVIYHTVVLNTNYNSSNVVYIAESGKLITTNSNNKLTLSNGAKLYNYGEVNITRVENNAGMVINNSYMSVSHSFNNTSVTFAGEIIDTAIILNYDSIVINYDGNGGGNNGNFYNNAGHVYNYNYFLIDNLYNNANSLFLIANDAWITTLSNVHNDGVIDNSGTFHSTANFLNNEATITGNGGQYIMDQNFNMGVNGVATCYGDPIDICSSDGTPPGASGINHITDTFCVWVCGEGSTLPIELLYFSAEYEENYVVVSWTTAVEIDNDYFEIQRSEDTLEWETIQTVPSKNSNSIAHQHYSIRDYQIQIEKVYYYRLAQHDFDGTYEEFHIVPVRTGSQISLSLELYPNPAGDYMNINIPTFNGSNIEIRILNTMGQIISETQIKKSNSAHLNLDKLAPGMYNILVEDGFGNLESKTFFKR